MERKRTVFAMGVLAALAVSACSLTSAAPPAQAIASTPIADLPVNLMQPLPTAIPQAIIDEADAEYLLLTNIYERVSPSVINIEVLVLDPHTGLNDLGRGSGFVYDTLGHIVTNAHVVKDAQSIRVTF